MLDLKKNLINRFIDKIPIASDLKNTQGFSYIKKHIVDTVNKESPTNFMKNPMLVVKNIVKNADNTTVTKSIEDVISNKYPGRNIKIGDSVQVLKDNIEDIIKKKNPLSASIELIKPYLLKANPGLNEEFIDSIVLNETGKVNENNNIVNENNNIINENNNIIAKGQNEGIVNFVPLISIIVVANIFTYSSFKFLNTQNKTEVELAVLYVIVYAYTVLYSIAMCFMSIWVLQLIEVGSNISMKQNIISAERMIKTIFDVAFYTIPFHILLGLLSLTFDKHLMFNFNKKYSGSFQIFSCILSIVVAVIYKDVNIQFDAETVIRLYIMFVTVLSLIKLNIKIDGTSQVDRFTNGFVNLFLNVNLKQLLVIMPLLAFVVVGIMTFLDVELKNMLLGIIVILVLGMGFATFTNVYNRYYKNNTDMNKMNQMKAVSKWAVFIAVYSFPILLYISTTNTELYYQFLDEFAKIFDMNFFKILLSGVIPLFFIDKAFNVLDEKQMTRLSSLVILIAIGTSKIFKNSNSNNIVVST